jgi:hypothetical protein
MVEGREKLVDAMFRTSISMLKSKSCQAVIRLSLEIPARKNKTIEGNSSRIKAASYTYSRCEKGATRIERKPKQGRMELAKNPSGDFLIAMQRKKLFAERRK